MRVTWTPDLAIGWEPIDAQHRELFAHVDRFLAREGRARVDELLELLGYLGTYVEQHFRTEEELMVARRYPGLEAHRAEHAQFRATFGRMVASFARYGDDPRVDESVRDQVIAWLDRHVRTTDRALGTFLREG